MAMNAKKTNKTMIVEKIPEKQCEVNVKGQRVTQVKQYKYLGTTVDHTGKCKTEAANRINQAKIAFWKKFLVLSYVYSKQPIFGLTQEWLRELSFSRLEGKATEMWFYRRMLRVSYTAHETNISVLQRMGQERQLLRTIKERQTSFTGHIIRKGELEDLILAGKVQGKKARGGQMLLFLNQVMENTGLTSPRTLWDAARNRTLKIKTS